MEKKYLLALCLAALLTPLSGHSQTTPGASCPAPELPREAQRYELDGVTTLRYAVGQDHRAMSASVVKSSGWKLLDNAALSNLSLCTFPAPTLEGETVPVQYVWSYAGGKSLRPLLVEGSCPASERFLKFNNLVKSRSDASGVLLRMLIGGEGRPWKVVAEAPDLPPELVESAVTFIQQCRFAIDPDVAGARTDTTYGRLLVK